MGRLYRNPFIRSLLSNCLAAQRQFKRSATPKRILKMRMPSKPSQDMSTCASVRGVNTPVPTAMMR